MPASDQKCRRPAVQFTKSMSDKDQVFADENGKSTDFKFGAAVAKVFDDMVN
ncbi:MAG: hypothetical protein IPN42_11430, partial [Methylococcaceae bacterium]|nr:hypothetical protein [Methylococcaceae bacterium]